MVDGSCAALRASAEGWPGSHLPAAAGASARALEVVLRGLAGVGGGRARLPLPRRGGRVVEALVGDLDLADLPAGLLERQLLAVDDGLGLRAGVALQGKAGIDGEGGAAPAATSTAA